jgi:hypothetical protein
MVDGSLVVVEYDDAKSVQVALSWSDVVDSVAGRVNLGEGNISALG